ncbi:MAG: PDZ domain-containing protein [Candidatus Altiarchaeales archaeon]|nr:PDZ domain-containing protein [Candidatus Altiarchaeales archaeon]
MPDLMQTEGVKVVDLMEDYPAEKALTENTVIHQFNGKSIEDFEDFMNESKKINPGDEVTLNTSEGSVTLIAAENPEDESKGYLGVYLTENIVYTGLGGEDVVSALGFSANTLFWVFFFNFNIALVNWVTLLPFDGGRMYKEVLDLLNLGEKNYERVFWGTQTMIGLLFFVNVLPLFESLIGFMLNLSPL